MYAYRFDHSTKTWDVGYWSPDGPRHEDDRRSWFTLRECNSEEEAAAFINYLHGGTGKLFVWRD